MLARVNDPMRSQVRSQDSDVPLRSHLAENPRLRPIVLKFGTRLEQQMLEFSRARAGGDLVGLARLAHWLRGAAGTVGYVEFSRPSLALENAARTGDAAALESAYEEIEALVARVERLPSADAVPNRSPKTDCLP